MLCAAMPMVYASVWRERDAVLLRAFPSFFARTGNMGSFFFTARRALFFGSLCCRAGEEKERDLSAEGIFLYEHF